MNHSQIERDDPALNPSQFRISADFENDYVGGPTAEAADFYGIVNVYTPIVFVFALGCSFLLLMMVFRSVVIPLKAIMMNLLSVGATYGLLVLVPASMEALGRGNWYLPSFLRWLPDLRVEGGEN